MDAIFSTLLTSSNQGLLWAVMAIGVYISYRILDFADLTVEGSLTSGGAIAAMIMTMSKEFVSQGAAQSIFMSIVSLLVAMIVGAFAGMITGLLNTKLKIAPILSGILTMTGLYTINMLIMGAGVGEPSNSLAFSGVNSLFAEFTKLLSIPKNYVGLIFGLLFAAAIIAVLYWFFGTEVGSAMRATGNNERMAKAQGINTERYKILGLMVSNAFVALSGALIAHWSGNASVTMGTGSIVIGLAAIIIGESIISSKFQFWATLASVAIGSIIYRIIIAFIMLAGLQAAYTNLLTAVLIVAALSIPIIKQKIKGKAKTVTVGNDNNEGIIKDANSDIVDKSQNKDDKRGD